MSGPSTAPGLTPQPRNHFEIDSLKGIDHAQWKIDLNRLKHFFNGSQPPPPPNQPPQPNQPPEPTLTPQQAVYVADLLPKDAQSKIKLDNDPKNQLLVAYLYFLHKQGGTNGSLRVTDIFEKVYAARFDPKIPNRKFNVAIPRTDEIMANIRTVKNPPKASAQTTALDKLQEIFAKLDMVCAHYGITQSPVVASLTTSANLVHDITNITNIGPLLKELMDLESSLAEKEEAETKRLAAKISARPAAEMAVYLCIRKEHEDIGKMDKYLEDAAIDDFARFLVGVTKTDFGGKPAAAGKGLAAELVGMKDDIVEWGIGVKEGASGRMSAQRLFAEFPILTNLGLAATPHDIEHALEKIDGKDIAIIIAYLRYEATTARTAGKGIAEQNLGALQTFTNMLEEVLAKKIAAAIKQGDPKDAYKRVAGVASDMLWTPLHHVKINPDVHGAKHIKNIPVPKQEGGQGAAGSLAKVGKAAGMIATGTQWLEILGALAQFKLPGKKEPKKD